jgi:hypothetical protein
MRGWAWHYALACLLALGLFVARSGGAVAKSPPCEDSFLRFFYQMYRQGSYCTCEIVHQEVVTEKGRVQHTARYTLPGLPGQQFGSFFELAEVRARFWGTIVDGPGGAYGGVIRLYEEGHEAAGLVRQIPRLSQGQEIEITEGVKHGMRLRPSASYHVAVEGQNPALRPQQVLMLQGRACFYLVSK